MKNSTLAQATLLALTRQNVTQKRGPLSTYTVRATCIQRNIREGETVIVQKYNDGEINRLSDMISTNNPFFVDAKNRIYDRVTSGNILRIRDGLSGEILDQGQHAYKITVGVGVMGYCTTQAPDNDNREIWRFVFADGSTTKPITLPYTGTYTLVFGYRNGILALANGQQSRCDVWTYNKDGDLLYALTRCNIAKWPNIRWVVPISATAVGVCVGGTIGGIFDQAGVDYYAVTYTDHFDNFGHMYAVYHGTSAKQSSQGTYLGHDQNYAYAYHQLHDPEDASIRLSEYVTCRFSIEDYMGAETLEQFETARTYNSTTAKNLISYYYRDENSRYHGVVVNRNTMDTAYEGLLDTEGTTTTATTIRIAENDGYIWDSLSGLYQKTALGTVMWPSSIYPKTNPFGQLGYALYSVTVGSIGEAIILFS